MAPTDRDLTRQLMRDDGRKATVTATDAPIQAARGSPSKKANVPAARMVAASRIRSAAPRADLMAALTIARSRPGSTRAAESFSVARRPWPPMNRRVASETPSRRITAWVLFGALAYLLAASLLSRLVRLPTLGDIGFTLVFTAFSLSHAAVSLGGRRTAVFFGVTALVSWLFEFYGVSTRTVYGAYHYGDGLGVKVGGVPALIPLAWFMMIYPSWHLAGILLGDLRGGPGVILAARSCIAALVMTMWDTVMDPAMASRGAWVWEQGGPYFGVPFQNYFGWLATTFTVYLLAGMLMRVARAPAAGPGPRGFRSLPVVIYALMAATYLLPRRVVALEPLRLVAAFTMGFAAVLGLLRMAFADSAGQTGQVD